MAGISSLTTCAAEFEHHEASILAWPYREEDWGERYLLISWCYAELVRILSSHEKVIVFCRTEEIRDTVSELLQVVSVTNSNVVLSTATYDHCWLRDYSPLPVRTTQGKRQWLQWGFNKWGNTQEDNGGDAFCEELSAFTSIPFTRIESDPARGRPVLEGGAFDTDGQGTFLLTESCLLHRSDAKRLELTRENYEQILHKYLGAEQLLWLPHGLQGDKTGGHLDNVARFIAPGKIALAWEDDPNNPNYRVCQENLEALRTATDALGRSVETVLIPLPKPIFCLDEILPASYTNFYLCNGAVLVPTFNDPNDRIALNCFKELFPEREVYGVYVRDLLSGGGALHCITQFLPAA